MVLITSLGNTDAKTKSPFHTLDFIWDGISEQKESLLFILISKYSKTRIHLNPEIV